MKVFTIATFLLVPFGLIQVGWGQTSTDETTTESAELDAENVPPPVPTPDDDAPRPQRQVKREADGSVLAYDFGVSLLPAEQGVRVRGVVVGSVAEAIGVKPNDIIVSVNKQADEDGAILQSGDVKTVHVLRKGREIALAVDGSKRQAKKLEEPRDGAATNANPAYAPGSQPRAYQYVPPSYSNRVSPGYRYGSPYPYYGRGGYYPVYRGPRVSIGIGVGGGRYYGPTYRRYGGYGGYGGGRGYYYNRRGGVGIRVGGIGIRF